MARGRSTLYLLLFFLITINYADRIALSIGAKPIADLLPSSSNAGTANGVLAVGGNIFGLLAPIVTGYVIEESGSYDAAWVISGGLLVAGAVISITLTRRPIGAEFSRARSLAIADPIPVFTLKNPVAQEGSHMSRSIRTEERGVALYAGVGPVLTRYDVDVERAELAAREAVILPENVQYAWPHASRRHFYVATSNSASGMGPAGDRHHVSAFALDPQTGALALHGAPIALPTRPIHMATDIPSRHILAAFNNPGAIRVYRIHADGTLGDEVRQQGPIDPGIFPHQVRATLDNRRVILVARGHDAAAGKPEEPGALKVFDYMDGVLSREVSVAPGGGYGFGPRHLDFHPARPWVYLSLERQNALDMFAIEEGALSPAPRFRKSTLSQTGTPPARQVAGAVHVHPNGRFVYAANRASATVTVDGKAVFAGGENTLAVYEIDPATGEPNPIQHVDTGGIHCRTFHIDPSGRLLVAAHIMALPVRSGDAVRTVPASLSVFRIAEDGRLHSARTYPVEIGDRAMFWMGMVPLGD